jgi:hypothetical protein
MSTKHIMMACTGNEETDEKNKNKVKSESKILLQNHALIS